MTSSFTSQLGRSTWGMCTCWSCFARTSSTSNRPSAFGARYQSHSWGNKLTNTIFIKFEHSNPGGLATTHQSPWVASCASLKLNKVWFYKQTKLCVPHKFWFRVMVECPWHQNCKIWRAEANQQATEFAFLIARSEGKAAAPARVWVCWSPWLN